MLVHEMMQAIRNTQGGIEFLVGSRSEEELRRIAEEWVDAEFTPSQAESWWKAGCFDASLTKDLDDADLAPSHVKENCPQLDGFSWGYAYCNNDVSLDDISKLSE